MYAPVGLAVEEGMAMTCLDGEPPPSLDALDFELLGRWSARQKVAAMARELGVSGVTVAKRMKRPVFQAALARLQRNFFDQLSRGEFGAMALVKANLVGNVKGLLKLARSANDERVQLTARLELIKLGGLTAPKPAVADRPEQLFDAMEPEELEHFAATGEVPRRLTDQLARMAVTVLEGKKKAEAATLDVEWEVAKDAEREAAKEVADEDGPAWEQMPDETELGG